jgi:hypothetical protein
VAHLEASGLRVEVVPTLPREARSAGSQARLLLFSPEVAEPGLALEDIAALAPAAAAGARTLLSAADRELDPDRRRALLYRAEQALRSQHVLIPLASVPVSCGARPGVHGLAVDLSGRTSLEDAWIEP